MNVNEYTINAKEQAEQNFEKIKESIKGLYDILNIIFEDDEENIYFRAGEDNIIGLYQNLVELLGNDYGLRHLIKKINKSEINLDIILDEIEI